MTVYEKMEDCLAGQNIAAHSQDGNWRVRYAAAIAIGESRDPKWEPTLESMLAHEDTRPLYAQPPALFPGKPVDQTRMAEHIGPIEAVFDREYDERTLEAWRCRGRVKQAILYALYDIGTASESFISRLHAYLDEANEDFCVIAAAARALGKLGSQQSLDYLEKILSIDEWCTTTEARKSIEKLRQHEKG